jgi:DNA-binding NarL/FixJ family response regulator
MGEGLKPVRASTVLICDDLAEMREMLRAVVELIPGLRVVGEAADGEVAITEASRLQPDLILLDLAMPVLSGFAALPTLRETTPASKIIVFAGFSTATVADEVLALGADRYIEKGADLETLIAAIENVVAGTTTLARSADV